MPTYEYECEKCGLKFERLQPITSAPLSECPTCRGRVQRLVSGGAGFILRGSGRQRPSQNSDDCSLQQTGRTCCDRGERCGKPACGDGE